MNDLKTKTLNVLRSVSWDVAGGVLVSAFLAIAYCWATK